LDEISDPTVETQKKLIAQMFEQYDLLLQSSPVEQEIEALRNGASGEEAKKRLKCLLKKQRKVDKTITKDLMKIQNKIINCGNLSFIEHLIFQIRVLEAKTTDQAPLIILWNMRYELQYFKRKIRQKLIESMHPSDSEEP
jgi:septum formation topological specificity factor MinE